MRTRKLPGPTPALPYRTCTPQNVGPESGDGVSHTHTHTANAEHYGGEGVVSGYWVRCGTEALGGSGGSGC